MCFDDAGCLHSGSQDILLVWQVVRSRYAIQITKVTVNKKNNIRDLICGK